MLHPAFSSPVRAIRVAVARSGSLLKAHYRIEGDLARVRVPPPAPPARADGLWRHTCCELFAAHKGSAAYMEFNFSPSGEWAAYDFAGYREPRGNAAVEPRFAVRMTDTLALEASVPTSGNEIGLSAVVEDIDGGLSYWALRHPPGKPDFHHRESFALELE